MQRNDLSVVVECAYSHGPRAFPIDPAWVTGFLTGSKSSNIG
jgi:hypothetical protein